ncbi:MAG: DUF881 domain-containing protein [Nocardioides sp.]
MTGLHARTPRSSDAAASAEASVPRGAPSSAPGPRHGSWRIGTPLAVLLSGALFAVSAANSEGTDLRPGRYTSLASVVQSESDAYERLQDRAGELKAEVDTLAASVDDREVRRKRRQADQLRGLAGLEPVVGTGISVVLSDASTDILDRAIADPELDLDRYVVHQQDLQAVINSLWAGGAAAITIQGQRIVTTTGIKCNGSAVRLQGIPYPEPYVIEAVGDPVALTSALDRDEDVLRFRSDALRPEIGVGWALSPEDSVEAPAYTGLLDIAYAEPVISR